ncbi:hypothetical protein HKD37_15G043198 [Glycine soja]
MPNLIDNPWNGRPSNKGMAPSKPGIMRLLEDKARRDVAEVVAAKVVAAAANDTTGGSVTPTNNLVEKENDDSQRRNVLRHDVRKNDLINLGESQDHPGSTKSDLQSPVDANVGDNWDFQDFQWMRM